MSDASLPALVAADPIVAAGVVARMAAAVAAGGLSVFPRLDLRVRTATALALAAVAVPAAVPAGDALPAVPLVVGELIVGCGLGLAAAVVFAAASWAGSILGAAAGLDWVDEFAGDEPAAAVGTARLAAWLAVAGFLATGGHLALVSALVESVRRLPVGIVVATGGTGLGDLVASATQTALALAVSLAAPALTAVVAFHVAAAISLRAVRLAAGPGLLQAAASLVLLAAVLAGADAWTNGFAVAVRGPLERCLLDPLP
ncbi:MAG: flagellar biosynthetic protein FliR [Planctomycetes bacterium]|nr:flagellar biosynthetic protein FliR [Planctomycetota bacterium]